MKKQPYASLELTAECIKTLAYAFPPKYDHISLDHITVEYGTDDEADLINPQDIEVIGYCDDGKGLEALLVRIDGQSFRDDGNPWHITVSYNKGADAPIELDTYNDAPLEGKADKRKSRPYSAVMSNKLIRLALNPEIAGYSVEYLHKPIKIEATPQIVLPEAEHELEQEADFEEKPDIGPN